MSNKSSLGRLTFSGRNSYEVVPIYLTRGPLTRSTVVYAAICECELGDHYLTRDGYGKIIEDTIAAGHTARFFDTYDEAQAAIEQWQRQRQVESEEAH